MARNKELIVLRNEKIKQRFNELSKEKPHDKYIDLLDELSYEFFITHRTISAVLNDEASYNKNN